MFNDKILKMETKYYSFLTSLNTAQKAGKKAPHKAILLLSIIELVEKGVIQSNTFTLSEQLEETFKRLWKRYVGVSVLFQPKVATPFWHLQNEPFYNLKMNNRQAINSAFNPYSVKRLRENATATIDEALFQLMKDETARAEMRTLLISNYLQHGFLANNKMSIISMISLLLHFAA